MARRLLDRQNGPPSHQGVIDLATFVLQSEGPHQEIAEELLGEYVARELEFIDDAASEPGGPGPNSGTSTPSPRELEFVRLVARQPERPRRVSV